MIPLGYSRRHGGRSAVKSSGVVWLSAHLGFGAGPFLVEGLGYRVGSWFFWTKDDWIVEWDPGHLRQHSGCFPGLLLDIFGRIPGVFPGLLSLLGSSAALQVFSLDWQVWQVAEFILLVESSRLCLRGFSEALSEGFPAVCFALVADAGDLCLAADRGFGRRYWPSLQTRRHVPVPFSLIVPQESGTNPQRPGNATGLRRETPIAP